MADTPTMDQWLQRKWIEYGACHLCHGPRDARMNVEQRDDGTWTMRLDLQCINVGCVGFGLIQ